LDFEIKLNISIINNYMYITYGRNNSNIHDEDDDDDDDDNDDAEWCCFGCCYLRS